MGEPDKHEIDWQILMAKASQRRHAEWSWPAILLVTGLAALALAWLVVG